MSSSCGFSSATLLSLPQLIDVALGGPEVGVVSFHILQNILQILVQQLNMQEVKVEYKGSQSMKIQKLFDPRKKIPLPGATKYTVYDPNKSGQSTMAPQAVVVISDESELKVPCFTVALPTEKVESMINDLSELRSEVNELLSLPTNAGILNAMKPIDQSRPTPVLDMYQILTVSKRMDAAEAGMQKLASLIEDLVRGGGGGISGAFVAGVFGSGGPGGPVGAPDDLGEGIEDAMVAGTTYGVEAGRQRKDDGAFPDGEFDLTGVDLSRMRPSDALQFIQKELERLNKIMTGEGDDASLSIRVTQIENKLNQCVDQINGMDVQFNNQFCLLMTQMSEIEREFNFLSEKLMADMNKGMANEEETAQNIIQLNDKFTQLEAVFNKVGDAVSMLLEDKDIKQLQIDSNKEQVEMLKSEKISRDEYEEGLADKVDLCVINRKVSQDQFAATCDDLSRGIEEALSKLLQQEELWQQALNDIQDEINCKLDKDELTPLRDFIDEKLKSLQHKVKALGALKKEQEAAATKSRFLRNVNCISCDKDVVMKKAFDTRVYPRAGNLPVHKSMAPYLAYELDQLRKQQITLPISRNMNHFEMTIKDDKSSINRYCGGDHTVTTPQQRVTRLGNFMEQWGPEISLAEDKVLRGKDGQIYRGGPEVPTVDPKMVSSHRVTGKPSISIKGDYAVPKEGTGLETIEEVSTPPDNVSTKVSLKASSVLKPAEPGATVSKISQKSSMIKAQEVPGKGSPKVSARSSLVIKPEEESVPVKTSGSLKADEVPEKEIPAREPSATKPNGNGNGGSKRASRTSQAKA